MNKSGKKPSRKQKIYIKKNRLNPDNWLVVKDSPNEFVVRHKFSGLPKHMKARKR